MGMVANKSIPELIPGAAHRVPSSFLDQSVAAVRIMDLKEARQLPKFVTVIVLAPEPNTEDGRALSQIVGNNSLSETAAMSKLVELFSKAMTLSKTKISESDVAFGDVRVSFSSMEASRKGESVTLTALEFKTLKYLTQHAGRVISRNELLSEVWGYQNYPFTRTVDNHILRLRQKLETDPSQPIHFQTVHGVGYKFLP